jgi:hypothetical protein
MIRKFGALALVLASVLALSACVVAPGPGYAGRSPCPGAWVPGHYGPYGWVRGHCA